MPQPTYTIYILFRNQISAFVHFPSTHREGKKQCLHMFSATITVIMIKELIDAFAVIHLVFFSAYFATSKIIISAVINADKAIWSSLLSWIWLHTRTLFAYMPMANPKNWEQCARDKTMHILWNYVKYCYVTWSNLVVVQLRSMLSSSSSSPVIIVCRSRYRFITIYLFAWTVNAWSVASFRSTRAYMDLTFVQINCCWA